VRKNGDGSVILPVAVCTDLHLKQVCGKFHRMTPHPRPTEFESGFADPIYLLLYQKIKLSLTKYQISSCTKLQRTVINRFMTLRVRELDAPLNTIS
jgi:hypothetical protein